MLKGLKDLQPPLAACGTGGREGKCEVTRIYCIYLMCRACGQQ